MVKSMIKKSTVILTVFIASLFIFSSCSNQIVNNAEKVPDGYTYVGFDFAENDTSEERTVLLRPGETDITKYLYSFYYTNLDEKDEEYGKKVTVFDKVTNTVIRVKRIAFKLNVPYKFELYAYEKAESENYIMDDTITTSFTQKTDLENPKIVVFYLQPSTGEKASKVRIYWTIPADNIADTLKVCISPNRFEYKNMEEVSLSTSETDITKKQGETVYDGTIDAGIEQWLNYQLFDKNGILLYEGSESVYSMAGRVSREYITIEPWYYYRKNVSIPVYKDGNLWEKNLYLNAKVKDSNNNEYVLTPVLSEGKPTGEFTGYLPTALPGTEGIFDIYVGMEDKTGENETLFIKTGATYNSNTSVLTGNDENISAGVELKTVKLPANAVYVSPSSGIVDSTASEIIVPSNQNFEVSAELKTGYKVESSLKVCGKASELSTPITLNSKDLVNNEITIEGVTPITYRIKYLSDGTEVTFKDGVSVIDEFKIETETFNLPDNSMVTISKPGFKINGWYADSVENVVTEIHKGTIGNKTDAQEAYLELNAHWVEAESVSYTVEHWFEVLNAVEGSVVIDGLNYVKLIEYQNQVLSGTVGTTTAATAHSNITGYSAATVTQKTITESPEVTVKVLYNLIECSISLNGNEGKWNTDSTKTITGKYGSSVTIADPVRQDYTLTDWTAEIPGQSVHTVSKLPATFTNVSATYTANWKAQKANWTLNIHKEKADSDEYDVTTEIKTGFIGEAPAYSTAPAQGFGFDTAKSKITSSVSGDAVTEILEDGSTVVDLYFFRHTFTITLKANGGDFVKDGGRINDGPESISVTGKYESTVPSVTTDGYLLAAPHHYNTLPGTAVNELVGDDFEFKHWVRQNGDVAEIPQKLPINGLTLDAVWTQKNGYYVVHYWAESKTRDSEGNLKLVTPTAADGFTGDALYGSVTKKDTIGNAFIYSTAAVSGFETPEVVFSDSTNASIAAGNAKVTTDTQTTVIVTYRRKSNSVKFHINKPVNSTAQISWSGDEATVNSDTITRTGEIGTTLVPPADPVCSTLTFKGWATKADADLLDVITVPKLFTEDSVEYWAVWAVKPNGGIIAPGESVLKLTGSVEGTTITAKVVVPYGENTDWNYTWSVNNSPLDTSSADVIVNVNELTLKNCYSIKYELTVVAVNKSDSKTYASNTVILTVGNN